MNPIVGLSITHTAGKSIPQGFQLFHLTPAGVIHEISFLFIQVIQANSKQASVPHGSKD